MKDTVEETNAEFRLRLQGAREASKGRAVTAHPVPAEPGSFSPTVGPPQCFAWVDIKWFPVSHPTATRQAVRGGCLVPADTP